MSETIIYLNMEVDGAALPAQTPPPLLLLSIKYPTASLVSWTEHAGGREKKHFPFN